MPRKSRMRGKARLVRRSRKSHIRSPRRVTFAPIGLPVRRRNCAIERRARVTIGLCPVIRARSPTAASGSSRRMCRERNSPAVPRTAPFAGLVYSLVLLWAAAHVQQGGTLGWLVRPWYRTKTAVAFPDLLTALQQWLVMRQDTPAGAPVPAAAAPARAARKRTR